LISRLSSRRAGSPSRRGFTLVELVIVVTILAVAAGVVFMRGATIQAASQIDATRAILRNARDAIVGSIDRPGFFDDLGEPPAQVGDLFALPAALPSGAAAAPFDPYAARGWNGPYLATATGLYALDAAHGFTASYGAAGAPALLDAWAHPIVLQHPSAPGVAPALDDLKLLSRLVSAGPDGILDTPPPALGDAGAAGAAPAGDDLLVYLFHPSAPGP